MRNCEIVSPCFEIHARFPSKTPKYEQNRNENISPLTNKVVKSNKVSRSACKDLAENVNNSLDDSFTKQFGVSFQESCQKCYNFETKKSCEWKRSMKRKIIMEIVNKNNEDSVSTTVDRLYGARQSLRGWDANRKKNHLSSCQMPKIEHAMINS